MILFYGYEKCATCRAAKAYLTSRGIVFKPVDITVTAPSKTVLHAIVRSGACPVPALFNRSGELYRAMRMKDRVKTMSDAEAIELLSKHGKLVRRPVVTDGTRHTVGFDAAVFRRVWG